ncbi:MAG TPA: hypothetical protein VE986_06995 [Hyphomicrobiales bacterium]|nr:hypothetical protein [Hyphomicrobiales bacterium]
MAPSFMLPPNKRPKHTIEMTAEPTDDASSSAKPADEAPERKDEMDAAKPPRFRLFLPPSLPRMMPGILGYLLAAIFGGIIAWGAGYLAYRQNLASPSNIDADIGRRLDQFGKRVDQMESMLRGQPAVSPAGPDTKSTALSEGLTRMEARLERAERELAAKIGVLAASEQSLEQKIAGQTGKDMLKAQLVGEIAPLSDRIASIERKLQTLAEREEQGKAEARKAALTLAFAGLKRALSEGRPFSEELTAVENLAPAGLPVLTLAPYRDAGIASLPQLQRDFEAASRTAIQSERSAGKDSLIGSIMSRARAAIQIRPSDGSGDSVDAVLWRMGAAVKQGDLKKAQAEAAALPAPARERMQGWLTQLEQRIMADEAVKKTEDEVLASLRQSLAAPAQPPASSENMQTAH